MATKITKYMACCTHPMCPGRGTVHCEPHPYDEEECHEVCCGALEEPSFCDIIKCKEGETTWERV